jgi:beta-phosphoglucomutase
MPDALIFDFDGIIVNTEPLHCEAFQRVLRPLGLGFSWHDYEKDYMGSDDRDAFRDYFASVGRKVEGEELAAFIAKKAAFFIELAHGADPFPGVVELIRSASKEIKVGLCSGALRSDIEPVAKRLGIRDCFSTIVTADDVSRSKPDPASYRLAVERLGVRADRAIAIEDTPAGIASAKGAGLRVLAVTNSHGAEHLDGADAAVESLDGLALRDVAVLVGLD